MLVLLATLAWTRIVSADFRNRIDDRLLFLFSFSPINSRVRIVFDSQDDSVADVGILRLFLHRSSHFDFLACLDSHQHEHFRDIVLDHVEHLAEQLERFKFVFLFRVLLGITAQMNTLTQMIQSGKMFAPVIGQDSGA